MLSVKLFGGAHIESEDGPLTGPAAQRHRLALLVILALSRERPVSRDKLLAFLWPERDAERGRNLLNQSVHALRKALGENAIVSVRDELRLDTRDLSCDVIAFEEALAEGDLERAVGLYAGPLLDGFFLSDAQEFEHWVHQERERLAASYAKALEGLAEAAEEDRDFGRAVDRWKARAAQDPYDSRVALRLMQALDASGNRAGALQHATIHGRLLQEEWGMPPASEVEALVERLRREPETAAEPDASRRREPARSAAGLEADIPSGLNGSPPAAGAGDPPEMQPDEFTPPAIERIEARPGYSAPVRASRMPYIVTAALAGAVGAATFWFVDQDSDKRWLLEEAIPRIEEYLDVADWESAYALAREAEARVPDSPELAQLWPRITWRVTIPSDPEGATVFRQAYTAPEDQWEELGRTPLVGIRIPYGLSRLRFELRGHRPMLRALGGTHINWREADGHQPRRPAGRPGGLPARYARIDAA